MYLLCASCLLAVYTAWTIAQARNRITGSKESGYAVLVFIFLYSPGEFRSYHSHRDNSLTPSSVLYRLQRPNLRLHGRDIPILRPHKGTELVPALRQNSCHVWYASNPQSQQALPTIKVPERTLLTPSRLLRQSYRPREHRLEVPPRLRRMVMF